MNELKLLSVNGALNGIGGELVDVMAARFGQIVNDANDVYQKSIDIRFDDVEPSKDEQELAKSLVKNLVKIRGATKKTKDDLKREAIDYNNAVQSVHNYIYSTVEGFEIKLKNVVDWHEIKKKEREAALKIQRIEALGQYKPFFNELILEKIGELTDDEFVNQFDLAVMLFNKNSQEMAEKARIEQEELEKAKVLQAQLDQERALRHKAEAEARDAQQAELKAKREAAELIERENAAKKAEQQAAAGGDVAKIQKLSKDVAALFNSVILDDQGLGNRKDAILSKVVAALAGMA